MQITHEEAHKLIDFDADEGLRAHQKILLTSHLDVCVQCRSYADSIQKMESVLRPMLHRNWDQQPIPLSIDMLTAKGKLGILSDRFVVATRIAALGVVFLTFFFGAWNFTLTSSRTPTPFLQSVPHIPTPSTSTMTASTEIGLENCTMVTHIVEKNDTLASIAYHFAVPIKDLVQANAMRSETVVSGQKLIVPVCSSTPTNAATAHTTTFTPDVHPITITPGGY